MNLKTLVLSAFLSFTVYFMARGQHKAISDSIDVLNYDIHLDLVHLSAHRISGFTTLKITPKHNNIGEFKLNLLKLTIDSIFLGNQKITNFSYNDTIIRTNLPMVLNTNDTIELTVHYHGIPQATTWGGFYFTADSAYAYNMGVGLNTQPHSYGKSWFPCIDEFAEKAFYNYYITVKNDKKAICGGTLISVTDNGNNTSTYHWRLHSEIPAYSSSVAVGNYVALIDIFNGINGVIPIQIYVPASDTNHAKASFIHLKNTLSIYESRYGPYLWERVGYVGVPFNNGAMEHATNISFPLFMIDGTLGYEDFVVHELSHQWFGNLATCSTEQDMWINEGWARYSESLCFEGLYGKEFYKNYVRNNHLNVIQTTHIVDNGYRAVYGIPGEYTYGNTVYDKGGDMVHT
jgi:aminopeptidase N